MVFFILYLFLQFFYQVDIFPIKKIVQLLRGSYMLLWCRDCGGKAQKQSQWSRCNCDTCKWERLGTQTRTVTEETGSAQILELLHALKAELIEFVGEFCGKLRERKEARKRHRVSGLINGGDWVVSNWDREGLRWAGLKWKTESLVLDTLKGFVGTKRIYGIYYLILIKQNLIKWITSFKINLQSNH